MENPIRLDGIRLIAPLRRSVTGSSWRAEDQHRSPLVVRFVELLPQHDDRGSRDLRERTTDAVRALHALAGRSVAHGILPWRSVRALEGSSGVAAVRAYVWGRLWDRYPESRAHPTVPPPVGLKTAFVELGRALDALHAVHPDARPHVVPNNLLTNGRSTWLADWGLNELLSLSAAASDVARTREWDPINGVLMDRRAMYWFPGSGARRTQAELAAAYFAIRTGLPLFGRDVQDLGRDAGLFVRELEDYKASGALRLEPLSDESERECLMRALAPDPAARFPGCAAFALSLRGSEAALGQEAAAAASGQEPWNLERFKTLYDETATERNGWLFVPQEHDVDSLQRRHEGGYWSTLAELASTCVDEDQFGGDSAWVADPRQAAAKPLSPNVTPAPAVGGESYYVAVVSGAEETSRRDPGMNYRLKLDHPGLQRAAATPSRGGMLAVINESELALLRNRGFEVRIETGPHPNEASAANALDNMFESPF